MNFSFNNISFSRPPIVNSVIHRIVSASDSGSELELLELLNTLDSDRSQLTRNQYGSIRFFTQSLFFICRGGAYSLDNSKSEIFSKNNLGVKTQTFQGNWWS